MYYWVKVVEYIFLGEIDENIFNASALMSPTQGRGKENNKMSPNIPWTCLVCVVSIFGALEGCMSMTQVRDVSKTKRIKYCMNLCSICCLL